MIKRIETLQDLRALVRQSERIGFVPTMGALHDGHLSLVRAAKEVCDTVIVSIFVNPTQFAPHEDFASYPRTVEKDCALLEAAGVTAVYMPPVSLMYPDGFATSITVDGVSRYLEGEFRPHFFQGVATVVAKLLLHVLPDKAFFGEKDFQQLQVIRRMVDDLNMPVEIVPVPTARDEYGLALSSRNAYLFPDHMIIARSLNKVLDAMIVDMQSGLSPKDVETRARDTLLKNGFDDVDYCTIRPCATLAPVSSYNMHEPHRALVAARIGTTRLIDNKPV
jgi:pantoate--beta-alanine ligase